MWYNCVWGSSLLVFALDYMDRTLESLDVATTSGGGDVVWVASPEGGQAIGDGGDAPLEDVFVKEEEIDPLTFVLTDPEQEALRIRVPHLFLDSTRALFNMAEYEWVNRECKFDPNFLG